ncbi:MAG TPA: DUF1540 domain-containing protein [Armatimonadota bacterium]
MTAEIKNCAVRVCYYNNDEICHARAILVGSDHPVCDTFITRSDQHGTPYPMGQVGECRESECKFNEGHSCNAASINVDYHDTHADCVTFEPISNLEKEIDVQLADETPNVTLEASANPRSVDERFE